MGLSRSTVNVSQEWLHRTSRQRLVSCSTKKTPTTRLTYKSTLSDNSFHARTFEKSAQIRHFFLYPVGDLAGKLRERRNTDLQAILLLNMGPASQSSSVDKYDRRNPSL